MAEPIEVHTGRAVPLRRSDVDTDQIIPAAFCKRLTRAGYADALFHRWRGQRDFVLNDPRYAGASVLLAGPKFGTGSSREHAVWALRDGGFRAVVAPSFGDIFRANAGKNQLVAACVAREVVAALWDLVERDPSTDVTIDVGRCELRCGQIIAGFELDAHTRWKLLEGLDDIEVTLRHVDDIEAFERSRSRRFPHLEAA
jgi:3-isopropylmalate/(R)-2-methylmalate dehydratase small subunit